MSILKKLALSLIVVIVVLAGLLVFGRVWLKQWVAEADSLVIDPSAVVVKKERPEVVEFFSYACPHCFSFEPAVERWLEANQENVSFRRVPAVLGPKWMPWLSKTPNWTLAKVYYALAAMGKVDELHAPLFQATHVDKISLSSEEELFAWLSQQGVDVQAFRQHFDSDEVSKQVEDARSAVNRYGVRATPTIVVNGHFRASLRTSEYDNARLIRKMDEFIFESRSQAGGAEVAQSSMH